MEEQLQVDLGQAHRPIQVDMPALKVQLGILEQANTPVAVAQPQKAAPTHQYQPISLPDDTLYPKGNEQAIMTAIGDQSLSYTISPSTATPCPQDIPSTPQRIQESPQLSRTLAQPRRYRPATGYEIRTPAKRMPARIYRTSLGPDTTQTLKARNAQPGSESRVMPISELITSRGKRTYTLWANDQQRHTDGKGTQVIITNVNFSTTFASYRGVSRRSLLEVLDDFNRLIHTQSLILVNLHAVQGSFVAAISTEKRWEQLREGVLYATR